MKKKLTLVIMVVGVVFVISIVLIGLRYNVYPYLFRGADHYSRARQCTYVCEDSEGMEIGTVCLDLQLDRFSRYYRGRIYKIEADWWESGNILEDKEAARLRMLKQQINGSYLSDSGVLANRFPYIVLQDGYYNYIQKKEIYVYDVYVDLGECYWILVFDDAKAAKELYRTSTVTVTYTGENGSDVEEVILWK